MAAPQPQARGGNLLTQKLGPLATWVWLIIATVLVGVVYLILKHKQAAAPAASSAGSTTGVAQVPDTIIQNYLGNTPSGGTTPPPATTPPPTTTPPPVSVPPTQPQPTPAPTTPAAQVTVPNLVGQRANFAIGQLESVGLTWNSASGPRNPKDEYSVSAQKPAPGTKVAKGTAVALTYKVIATPTSKKK